MEKIAAIVYVEVLILPFLSYMLYDFMQEGMIFGRYGKWLETINPFLAKPLGACLKCFHVWVVIIFTLLFLDFELSKFIISLGASYVILDKSFFK